MSLSASLEQVTLDQFIRHAHLFGTECVFETGEQEGLRSADLARLRIELDELDAGRKFKHSDTPSPVPGTRVGHRLRSTPANSTASTSPRTASRLAEHESTRRMFSTSRKP